MATERSNDHPIMLMISHEIILEFLKVLMPCILSLNSIPLIMMNLIVKFNLVLKVQSII